MNRSWLRGIPSERRGFPVSSMFTKIFSYENVLGMSHQWSDSKDTDTVAGCANGLDNVYRDRSQKKLLLSSLRVELIKLSTPSGLRTQQMHEKQHA